MKKINGKISNFCQVSDGDFGYLSENIGRKKMNYGVFKLNIQEENIRKSTHRVDRKKLTSKHIYQMFGFSLTRI